MDVLRGWRERWRHPEVKPAALQLAGELMLGEVRSTSPFGLVDGRVDLRGLQVDLLSATRDPMYQRLTVEGGHWRGLDLTGAGLSHMSWHGLRVSGCVLVDSQLDGLRCWGVEVSDCYAARVSLRNAQIGAPAPGLPRSSWRRVDLTAADLRQLLANVVMEDIDLSRAKLGGANLAWSDLIRVRFAGTVKGLTIGDLHTDKRPANWVIQDVDFGAAKPADLRLTGVDLGSPGVGLRLPEDGDHWVIRDWTEFLARVEANARGDGLRRDADIWVDYERRHLGPRQEWGFCTAKDALDYAGKPFLELLRACR